MIITRMRSKECREFLSRVGFGRLGCSLNNRPYIVPLYFVFEFARLYCFSTLGQKVEYMRQNPLVCVQTDQILSHDDWVSVVVLGKYVEIPNTPENAKGREHARTVLTKRALWRQSGYTATQTRRQSKPAVPVYYCIQVEQITGLRASPD
ncbi:MAG TPA: pyridoxamine 5'-phosphate oxidase family protein, partial [Candidatus Acidoferrum sp.]